MSGLFFRKYGELRPDVGVGELTPATDCRRTHDGLLRDADGAVDVGVGARLVVLKVTNQDPMSDVKSHNLFH